MVLVDALLPTNINLKIYYWINGKEHSVLKVRSSIIRLLKTELQNRKILLYPVGFPPIASAPPRAQDLDGNLTAIANSPSGNSNFDAIPITQKGPVIAKAEGGLNSEAEDISEQAKQAQTLKEGENLLKKPVPTKETKPHRLPNPSEFATPHSSQSQ